MEVYLDKAATCGKIPPEVIEEIKPYLAEMCGNASSLYSIGRKASNAIKTATERIKIATGAKEVYYTSGATESNNWIINNFRQSRIIASEIEHPSILNTLRFYKDEYKTDYKLIVPQLFKFYNAGLTGFRAKFLKVVPKSRYTVFTIRARLYAPICQAE